jgi:hypothetical protein
LLGPSYFDEKHDAMASITYPENKMLEIVGRESLMSA